MATANGKTAHKGTIRFEDLGEPVQRLLKSLQSGYSEEDMALLEYVSVKDMAKIYGEMATDRHTEEIWAELRAALLARKDKASRREAELDERRRKLEEEQAQEDVLRKAEEDEAEERERAEEERRRRKAERKKRREAEAEAAVLAEEQARILAEQQAEEEAARQEEEERLRKEERRKKRRAARERELREEQEALEAEHAKQQANKSNSQKKDWADYVASHPLEFTEQSTQSIEQEPLKHTLKAPPKVTEELLNRTYTPKCPNCGTKFSKPPVEWDCPMCLRRHHQKVKVWQPDDSSTTCMICRTIIGRFSRHHCRNCGRLVCSKCCDTRAFIPSLGFKDTVKVCDDCGNMQLRKDKSKAKEATA